MVNKYTDQIIDMFVSEYTPGEICTELRLCKKQAPTHFISNEIPPLPSQNSLVVEEEEPRQEDEGLEQGGQGPLCVLCEFAISVLDRQILLANRTLDMVERGVELVCSYLPRSVEQGCDDFVDEYGDQVLVSQPNTFLSLECQNASLLVDHPAPRASGNGPQGSLHGVAIVQEHRGSLR